jgi:hypothetical protein
VVVVLSRLRGWFLLVWWVLSRLLVVLLCGVMLATLLRFAWQVSLVRGVSVVSQSLWVLLSLFVAGLCLQGLLDAVLSLYLRFRGVR